MTREEAFKLGYQGKLLDNPFWSDYPNNPMSEEADLGRWYVDGWLCQEQSYTISR